MIEINRKSKLNAKNRYQELETSFKELIAQFVEENKSILPPEEYEVAYDEFVIEIRGFGQFFARACLGEDFRNVM
ncbi:MAG: hypothetical protein MR436_11365 [Eubacterium sp.]|nr:hypothetical protein [Eubacterium sp.]